MPPRERLSPKKTVGFLRRLAPRVRPYRMSLAAAAVLMLMSTGVGLAFPLVVRELLDAAFLANDSGLLNRVALGLLVLFAGQAVVNFSQSYLTASVSERVVADLRRDLFTSLVHQPPGFFAARRVGELTSRLASDSGLVQNVLRFGVPEIIRQGIFLVGALVLVTITHPRLTLVTLTAIPFAALVGWFFGRRVRHLSTHIQDRLAEAVSRAEQVFTQIRTVQSFTREGYEARAYETEVNRARDEGLRRAVARASLTGAITFAAFGAIVVVLWEGGRPRFFDVEEGGVSLDGVDVRDVSLHDLRSEIGIVPQEPMLFAGTLRENMIYGNLEATETEIEEAARAAHASEFIAGLPNGLDQVVGERGVTLSAGQRQRVAIARVILERPRVLILDEASSSLDSESEALVQDALEHLMEGLTTLVIAHRLSTVIRADRILVLDQGTIVDQGSHRELLERSEVYDRLYRRQSSDAMAF